MGDEATSTKCRDYALLYIDKLYAQLHIPEIQEISEFEEQTVVSALQRLPLSLLSYVKFVVTTAHKPILKLCEREYIRCQENASASGIDLLHEQISALHEQILSWILQAEEAYKREVENIDESALRLIDSAAVDEHVQFKQKIAELSEAVMTASKQTIDFLLSDMLVDVNSNRMFRGVDVFELDKFVFTFPGIDNSHPFYCVDDFEGLRLLERQFAAIQQEYLNFTALENFSSPGITFPEESVQNNWKTLWLMIGGSVNERNCLHFPKTVEILKSIPRVTREVLFSVLLPGAYIPPHKGNINTSLRCHLGICGLENCGLKVGEVTVQQKEGEVLVFDDFLLHSAWNNATIPRVVLIIDIIHPDLTEEQYDLYGEIADDLTSQSEAGKLLHQEIDQLQK